MSEDAGDVEMSGCYTVSVCYTQSGNNGSQCWYGKPDWGRYLGMIEKMEKDVQELYVSLDNEEEFQEQYDCLQTTLNEISYDMEEGAEGRPVESGEVLKDLHETKEAVLELFSALGKKETYTRQCAEIARQMGEGLYFIKDELLEKTNPEDREGYKWKQDDLTDFQDLVGAGKLMNTRWNMARALTTVATSKVPGFNTENGNSVRCCLERQMGAFDRFRKENTGDLSEVLCEFESTCSAVKTRFDTLAAQTDETKILKEALAEELYWCLATISTRLVELRGMWPTGADLKGTKECLQTILCHTKEGFRPDVSEL